MKRTPSDVQFIMITLLLVSLLGVRTAYSLMEEEEIPGVTIQQEASLGASPVRSPASVGPVKIPVAKANLQAMMNLDLSCGQGSVGHFKAPGSFIQFKGKNCLKNFKQDQIEIVNKSNGYTASLFPFGKDQYQTDMIQLIHGENEIHIRYSATNGSKFEKTIRVSSTSDQ